MKPAPFDYLACDHQDEALECLAQAGDEARVLAGGQSLIAMLNMRLLQPEVLVDISRIASLSQIDMEGDAVRIGAAVTQAQLQRHEAAATVPLLAQALPFIGHFQTRNKGTVCGSLAHADPSSELPLVACVLNASITLTSSVRRREINARAFFTGLLQTSRTPEEMITHVSVPKPDADEAFAFKEMAMRHGDFAIICVAAKVTTRSITIGIGGGADKPEVREFDNLAGSALDDALNALAWELPLQDDVQASAAYRRRLVRLLGRQTIEEARSCLV